jgi:SAM-dependent methyltransferase
VGWSPAERKGFLRWAPQLAFQTAPALGATIAGLPAGTRIADLGAGGRRATPATICVDMALLRGTNVVADVHRVPFSNESLDCVICTGTLEHVADPNRVVQEIHRILRPGGIIHIEIPFLQPFHADPNDYHRWTLPGLEQFCESFGFEKVRSGVHMGPASALAVILQEFFALFAPGAQGRKVVRVGMRFALFWMKYLDYLLIGHEMAHVVASGCYFVGVRREAGENRR